QKLHLIHAQALRFSELAAPDLFMFDWYRQFSSVAGSIFTDWYCNKRGNEARVDESFPGWRLFAPYRRSHVERYMKLIGEELEAKLEFSRLVKENPDVAKVEKVEDKMRATVPSSHPKFQGIINRMAEIEIELENTKLKELDEHPVQDWLNEVDQALAMTLHILQTFEEAGTGLLRSYERGHPLIRDLLKD